MCKIAPIFEIQHDVLLNRISVRQLRMTDWTQNREIPPSYSPIKFAIKDFRLGGFDYIE